MRGNNMKKEYDLSKLKKRPGTIKSDPSSTKVPISLRIDGCVLAALKDEAIKRGLPYQTFISSILHQFVNGELVEKKIIEILQKSHA